MRGLGGTGTEKQTGREEAMCQTADRPLPQRSVREPRPESALAVPPCEGDPALLLEERLRIWPPSPWGVVRRNVPQADFAEGEGEALRTARQVVLWVTAVPCWRCP